MDASIDNRDDRKPSQEIPPGDTRLTEWARVKDYTHHERLFSKLQRIIGRQFPQARFVLFGSAGAQLAIHGSDIDILVTDHSVKFVDLFNTSYRLLLSVKSFKYVERVVCNVPILKLKDAETNLQADICFNREDSFKGVISALHMQISFPELRPLYFVLKAFLRERNYLD